MTLLQNAPRCVQNPARTRLADDEAIFSRTDVLLSAGREFAWSQHSKVCRLVLRFRAFESNGHSVSQCLQVEALLEAYHAQVIGTVREAIEAGYVTASCRGRSDESHVLLQPLDPSCGSEFLSHLELFSPALVYRLLRDVTLDLHQNRLLSSIVLEKVQQSG